MRFSLAWLGDYVELPDPPPRLAARLTAAGHAVEGIEEVEGEAVLDVDVTTNRVDAMCHLGLARELAAIYGTVLRPPAVELPADRPAPPDELVTLEAPALCRRYVGLVVRGVTVGPSPDWLRCRLAAIGLRPINNVVDVTNYVLWELGQPLHAFDLATLGGGRVVVRQARAGERLRTLDGEERALGPEMLVIADERRPVALAGVMGGAETEVSTASRDLLLESAWFDPASVRRTARQLGMHTDASHRFERGADLQLCRFAAERAAALLREVATAAETGAPADVRGEALEPPAAIELAGERLDAFAGTAVPAAETERILAALGCGLQAAGAGHWRVTVPSWRRFDLLEEADLFEEVLRLVGYDRIPASLPPLAGADAPEPPAHTLRRRLQDHLAACGYGEAIDWAFYSREDEGRFPALAGEGEPLPLENPLSERYALMRRSLLPPLLASARFNRRRNLPAVRLFEVGHVFWRDPEGRPQEEEHVALACGGTLGTPWERQVELDLFDLKGVVESLAQACGQELCARPAELPGLASGAAAELLDAVGTRVGVLGRVAEDDGGYPLYAAELRTATFLPLLPPAPVRLPPRVPGVAVDLTLTHRQEVTWAELAEAIRAAAVPDLADCALKDRYTGEGVPPGAVNTTIAFHYQAAERSLTQEEVNDRQTALAAELERRFGWREPT
ncbi:MAG TPA: phenylalanine--tRNA ligase subunit beta [Thermoanaerobaculia bacterium]|nr:phenylalanine--tRNA ligase subunit beta [Thermoanaerobaculia bacterium]